MIAFYFTGIVDFQDMATTLFETIRQGYKVWICIFDCLEKKRQFYYYEKDELIDFVKDMLGKNNLSLPLIEYFGQEDEEKFKKSFHTNSPELAFIQGIWHKYPVWIPVAPKKVVHFTWSYDTIHTFHKSPYKNNIVLNVARYKIDKDFLSQNNVTSCEYFGNTRLSQLKYNKNLNCHSLINLIKDKKTCFIPERWFRKEENEKELITNIQNILLFLKSKGYTIVWKRREKGYPFNESHTILHKLSKEAAPEIVIEKDTNFPSSMMTMFEKSNLVLLLGITTSFVDSSYIKNANHIIVYNSDPSHVYNKFAIKTLEEEKSGGVTIVTGNIDNIKKEINAIDIISSEELRKNKDFKIKKEINAEINIIRYLKENNLI